MKFRQKPLLYDEEEIERERLDRLRQARKNLGYNKKEKKKMFAKEWGKANTLSSYEVKDRAAVIMDIVDGNLCGHPFVLLNREAWQYAAQAHLALWNLYQCVGTMDSNADPEQLEHLNKPDGKSD